MSKPRTFSQMLYKDLCSAIRYDRALYLFGSQREHSAVSRYEQWSLDDNNDLCDREETTEEAILFYVDELGLRPNYAPEKPKRDPGRGYSRAENARHYVWLKSEDSRVSGYVRNSVYHQMRNGATAQLAIDRALADARSASYWFLRWIAKRSASNDAYAQLSLSR